MYLGKNYRAEHRIDRIYSIYELRGDAFIHVSVAKLSRRLKDSMREETIDRLCEQALDAEEQEG